MSICKLEVSADTRRLRLVVAQTPARTTAPPDHENKDRDAYSMSVSKVLRATRASHGHATPELTVKDRPHGHKDAPIANVAGLSGDSAYEYTDQFAAVAERGVESTPEQLADYYCSGLPDGLHLLITIKGQVKHSSWEQAATAAARLYETKQTVLELQERSSRAIRAAVQARGTQRNHQNETSLAGNPGNCYQYQCRGYPRLLYPRKGERTKRQAKACRKCGVVGHCARDCPPYDRGRSQPEGKSSRQPTRHRTETTEPLSNKLRLSSKHLPALDSFPKFERRYQGPSEVIDCVTAVVYRPALPLTYEYHNVFHASQLVPHRRRLPRLVTQDADAGWTPIRKVAGNPTQQQEVDYSLPPPAGLAAFHDEEGGRTSHCIGSRHYHYERIENEEAEIMCYE
ncbi:hypothetical protein ENH_00036830 [Eimeria necatrix]|uniref:CCHC-type domain-containing protein n=1 Tax=Eimeria necatrix TaxID=51315 RepID=U6ML59_9EIME|nr:hypothetical protein ENH_00036830 [Eimeria necatrix]CDJ63184.1 hypothetical protein ENH_00036830 [Eimeria necatrix]